MLAISLSEVDAILETTVCVAMVKSISLIET